jgi:A/G-specific adenine glycosylase
MKITPEAAETRVIRRRLLTWWRRQTFAYPWRSTDNAWLALAAEIMLQRTRARQVLPAYEQFARAYPTPESFLADPLAGRVTATLGLHMRAEVLVEAAQVMMAGIPTVTKDLQAIRGVGAYTAAAWLSLHRGQRAVIVDSNVFRWLGRMTGRPYHRDPRGVRWVRDCADTLTPVRSFRAYNYAVLDFTMSICLPRQPRCSICPVRRLCEFNRRPQRTEPTIGAKSRNGKDASLPNPSRSLRRNVGDGGKQM